MIIWSGWGILVPVIAFTILLTTQAVADSLTGVDGYYSAHSALQIVALLAGAVALWFLGRYLNGKPGRRLIDKETGQEFLFRRRHTFFWINMEYWGVALAAVAFAIPFF